MMLHLNPTSHYGKIISKFLNLCDCMYTNTEETLYCRQSKVHKIYQDTLKVNLITMILLLIYSSHLLQINVEILPWNPPHTLYLLPTVGVGRRVTWEVVDKIFKKYTFTKSPQGKL